MKNDSCFLFFSLITYYPVSILSKVLTSNCHPPKSFIASEVIEGARSSDVDSGQEVLSTFLQNEGGTFEGSKVSSNTCTLSSSYKYESDTAFPPFFETREFDVDSILQLHDGAGATHLQIDLCDWMKCDFENCCCMIFFYDSKVILLEGLSLLRLQIRNTAVWWSKIDPLYLSRNLLWRKKPYK